MRRRWSLIVGATLAVALLLWGMGVFGQINAGERAKAAALKAKQEAALKAKRANEAAYHGAAPVGSPTYSLTFSDTTISQSQLTLCYPDMDLSTGCTNFGNKEYEWYLPSQVQESGGDLRLVAQRLPTQGTASNGSPATYECRSGMVTTYNSLRFKYGFLQIDADLDHTPGLWSALWLGTVSGVWPPEVDMVESWGINYQTWIYFHPPPASVIPIGNRISPQETVGWQKYSLYWSSTKLEIFIGTKRVMNITSSVPQLQMYLLADLAEYLPATAGNCSGQLDIRSIKYWKL